MKKTILVLFVFLPLLMSCSSTKDVNKAPISDDTNCFSGITTIDDKTLSTISYQEWLFSESQFAFWEKIEDNLIDCDYQKETTDGSVDSIKELEKRYIIIWQQELDFSCGRYEEMLEDSAKGAFLELQKQWTENLQLEMDFIENQYASKSGTLFWLERQIYYKECIRRRTLYVKYLTFLLDEETNVEFLYNGMETIPENSR